MGRHFHATRYSEKESTEWHGQRRSYVDEGGKKRRGNGSPTRGGGGGGGGGGGANKAPASGSEWEPLKRLLSLEKLEKLEKLEEILLPRRAMLDREKVSRCVEMLSRRSRK